MIRSLADLAAEVEELAAEHTDPEVLVERVRALAYAQALEPVGQAGQKLPLIRLRMSPSSVPRATMTRLRSSDLDIAGARPMRTSSSRRRW
ncbi:hypothetical protein V2I01_38660 [Micromonospora sp. BRA006-A]|nr:hypothetical protein [Micromonospora sp. BRA006-A]